MMPSDWTLLPETAPGWAVIAAAWLLTYLIHSTMLLGSAWICVSVFSSLSDSIREHIWKFALVMGLLTATVQSTIAVDPLGGSVSLAMPAQHATDIIAGANRAGFPSTTGDPTDIAPFGRNAPTRGAIQDGRSIEHAENLAGGAMPFGDTRTFFGNATDAGSDRLASSTGLWTNRLLLLLVLVTACGSLGFALAWLRLRRFVRHRHEVTHGPLRDVFDRLRRDGRVRRRVRLTCSHRIETPIAFGILRPEICVPHRALNGLPAAHQQSMLAHELAHHARHDPLWLCVTRLIECVLFLQPLNRVARRRLRELAEYRCDAWAVEQTGGRLALARCLVEVAAWLVDRQPLPVAALASPMAHRRSNIETRIERIFEPEPFHDSSSGRLSSTAMFALVATAVVALTPHVAAVSPETVALPETASQTDVVAADAATPDAVPPVLSVPAGEPSSSLPGVPDGDLPETLLAELDVQIAMLEDEAAALASIVADLGLTAEVADLLERLENRVAAVRDQRNRVARLLTELNMTTAAEEIPADVADEPLTTRTERNVR